MKKKFLALFLINIFISEAFKSAVFLEKYKDFLIKGTLENQDWSSFKRIPKSRYFSFNKAFEAFEKNKGGVVVELGTSRSFVHGGLEGCNSSNVKYWTPDKPERWDWGAGFFTRMACECLGHLNPVIHTVDLMSSHINRCKIMTKSFKHLMHYHVCSSVDFLKRYNVNQGKIDLLYLDTGDMTPLEPTARLHLEEARVVVQRNLIGDNGIILIDDVKNQTPKKFGEKSDLGKAKYSIPYFLRNGFKLLVNEYQVILVKS